MPTVTIALSGRNYDIACGPGEENRVQEMATKLRQRLEDVTNKASFAQDSQVFVVVSLLLMDELDRATQEVQQLRLQQMEKSLNHEAVFAETIEKLAEKLEALALRLEAA